jgi:hypothetical protein
MVASGVRIDHREPREDEASNPLPTPGHNHDREEKQYWSDVNRKIRKRLNQRLPIPKRIQAEHAQEAANENAENSRAPEE